VLILSRMLEARGHRGKLTEYVVGKEHGVISFMMRFCE
jgi:hypothetical protein